MSSSQMYRLLSGVPEAIVAIGCVERLCALMYSEQAQVRGSAAIALAYLSFNHTAERQLLNKWVTFILFQFRSTIIIGVVKPWQSVYSSGVDVIPILLSVSTITLQNIRYLENSRKNGDTIKELVVCHAYREYRLFP